MWGGRFAAQPDDAMQAINASIDIDKRLWREDIEGSKAHADMLATQGIITNEDNAAIQAGLDEIAGEIVAGTFPFSAELEDIHLNIEARLTERIGEAGKRLHTGRSRNDQVATDFKLWTMRASREAADGLRVLQRTLVKRAEGVADWIMPGFTHLQTAQPVTLGHHLLAYVTMLERDRVRIIGAALEAAWECPLGSAALAGTSYKIDRDATAHALGFHAPASNSLDAVGSRDFALAALANLTISATNLSRLAEEIVLWTSPQFGFATLSDAWSTGSSIMPQKRNPDAAELIRAKAARVSADFAALNAVIQKLPLAYAKDLQEDKALTFAAFDAFALSVTAMIGMIDTMRFNRSAMREAAARGYSTATDLADWLVRELRVPFREAHEITGRVVRRAEETSVAELSLLPLSEYQAIDGRITEAARALLTVEKSVESRDSYGGTAPQRVREQIERWKEMFA
ncbi:argininosuccinate lyase [Terricaulis silvestris]|uniref:Argininosuccinate lyase n=1 Tax=Terricaulis silvestris TaxID=2686094 RepID=A0A6I6MPF9_9CAUL|nr:argininosuccinate lyase [Terricaulis silvestris]QGZ96041.1 Argininosuccinate lyase 1 [Terricaulis silvestris]